MQKIEKIPSPQQLPGSPAPSPSQVEHLKIEQSIHEFSRLEARNGLKDQNTYQRFANEVLDLKRQATDWLNSVDKNTLICGYGAAAKATVFLNLMQVNSQNIKFIVDKNPEKQNKKMPGTDIPIQPIEHLVSMKPEFIIIFVWKLIWLTKI